VRPPHEHECPGDTMGGKCGPKHWWRCTHKHCRNSQDDWCPKFSPGEFPQVAAATWLLAQEKP